MSDLTARKEAVTMLTIHDGNPNMELMRLSKHGIWVNPDIPVDEVAQRVFAVLEPLIKQAYVSAAHGLTERVLTTVQSDARIMEPLPPISEAMDALMREASA